MTGLRLALVVALAVVLSAQSWTEDQGEAGGAEDEFALGIDVQAKLGAPSGPTLRGDALDAATATVASRLRCPACQGLSINDSPAETARNMKRQVRAMLAAGYDAEQVNVYFESAYGEFVLMAPKVEGLNLLVWGAPVLLVFGGLLFVFGVVGRKGPGTGAVHPPARTDDPYLKRIREEVDGA